MKLRPFKPEKTTFNACPICNLPRGVGSEYEFSHGPCMEAIAKTEGKGTKKLADQVRKRYASGKLPKWMFD